MYLWYLTICIFLYTAGGLAQLVECVVSNDEARGSKPRFSTFDQPCVLSLVHEQLIGWPSGLRRQLKALFSSEARVRTPLLSTQFGQGGANTPAWIRTRVARFKVWSANHYTTGAAARLAQSVARGSHNPKVVSSILAPRTFIRKQWRLSSVG